MALAQRLLQRRVQLAGVDVAVVEVAVDEVTVDLDHLLDERAVRIVDAAEVAVAGAVVEAVDHLAAVAVGQVQRQALLAERGLDVDQQIGQVGAGGIDLVDDDQAVEMALCSVAHHAHGHGVDAVDLPSGRVDHHGGGLHRFERRQRLADEIRGTRGVDEVDACAGVLQVHQCGVQRVRHLALERIEVAHRRPTLEAACGADHAAAQQQGLGQAGLATALWADECERADAGGVDRATAGRNWAGHGVLLGRRHALGARRHGRTRRAGARVGRGHITAIRMQTQVGHSALHAAANEPRARGGVFMWAPGALPARVLPRCYKPRMVIRRRTALALAGGGLALPSGAQSPRTRAMPSSGERLPAVGLGTWLTFDVPIGDAPAMARRREVVVAFLEGGGRVIDSSPMYGHAEAVLGELLPPGDARVVSATKVWTPLGSYGPTQMRRSLGLWKRVRVDLMQVHNLLGWRSHLPTLREWKAQGRIRYIGVTTSHGNGHDAMQQILRTERGIDVMQITYNPTDRRAEPLLELAARQGVAVIVNRPFDGGALLDRLARAPLPAVATALECAHWATLVLKWELAHPAVTVVIPATTDPAHVMQNLAALHGPLPDAAQREAIWRAMAPALA